MNKPEDAEHILQAIVEVACQFLTSDMGVKVQTNKTQKQLCERLTLKPVTAMMSISGCLSLDVTFSFDSELIAQLFNVYCHELTISDDERTAYIGETACDVINIVIGNSTEFLAQDGTAVNISVPKVLNANDCYSISPQEIISTIIATNFGELEITTLATQSCLP